MTAAKATQVVADVVALTERAMELRNKVSDGSTGPEQSEKPGDRPDYSLSADRFEPR